MKLVNLLNKIKNKLNTKILLIVLGMVAIILLVVSKSLKIEPLEVISHDPPNQTIGVSVNTNIKIEFNRPLLSLQEIAISIRPQTTADFLFSEDKQTVTVDPIPPFHSGQLYKIVILDSKQQLLKRISFTTEELLGDPQVVWESEQHTQTNYPLMKYLPYETDQFAIFYDNQPLTLKVFLKVETKEQIEQVVFDWIKSQGINPNSHKINWFNPELSPIP